MRRAILALTGVVAGTTILLSVKSAPGATRLPAQVVADQAAARARADAALAASGTPLPAGAPAATAGSGGPVPTGKATPGAPRRSPPPSTPAPSTPVQGLPAPRPTGTAAPPTGAPGPITGDSAFTEFGYVTVAITVANGKITDVIAVEMPADESRSKALSDAAAPELRKRALAAQSSHIDTYSGATWTSDAYRRSLQSAIDKAGLG
jgi:uncharacterized protein with FMN-binding domain